MFRNEISMRNWFHQIITNVQGNILSLGSEQIFLKFNIRAIQFYTLDVNVKCANVTVPKSGYCAVWTPKSITYQITR